jgi:hypothetical protein
MPPFIVRPKEKSEDPNNYFERNSTSRRLELTVLNLDVNLLKTETISIKGLEYHSAQSSYQSHDLTYQSSCKTHVSHDNNTLSSIAETNYRDIDAFTSQRQGYMYCDGYVGLIYPWEVGTLKTIWHRSLSLSHTAWLDWTWPNAVFSQISFQKISLVLCFCRCIAAMMAYKLDGHCCSAVDRLDGRLARGQQKRILIPQFLFICRISFVLSQIFVTLTIDFKRII